MLLTTPFAGTTVCWFLKMKECKRWRIFSFNSQRVSYSDWQKSIGTRQGNVSGNWKRLPMRREKRSGAVNILFLIWKRSYAGSRSGWCIT